MYGPSLNKDGVDDKGISFSWTAGMTVTNIFRISANGKSKGNEKEEFG